jgi:hypothetical protein
MGRPSLLTNELAESILRAIRAGVPYKTAAGAHGIHYATFQNWRVRGRDALAIAEEHEIAIHPDDEPYVEFFEGVQRARDEGKAALVTLWRTAAVHDWRAARALLAVYEPETYAERSRYDVHVTPGAQVGEVLPDERGAPAEVSELPNVDRADRLLGIAAEAGLLDAASHE